MAPVINFPTNGVGVPGKSPIPVPNMNVQVPDILLRDQGTAASAPTALQDLKSLESPLLSFVERNVDSRSVRYKTIRLAQVKKNILYLRGKQYLVPKYDGGIPVDYRPVEIIDAGKDLAQEAILMAPIYNHVRSLHRKFQAVLSQRSPNVTAEALVEGSDQQAQMATVATRHLQALRKFWPTDELQSDACWIVWNAGTIFPYVEWVTDEEKYGTRTEISEQEVPQEGYDTSCLQCGSVVTSPNPEPACSSCGSPLVSSFPATGTKVETVEREVPNGAPELKFESEISITFPLMVRKISETPWIFKEVDVYAGELITKYPSLDGVICDDTEGDWKSPTAQARQFIASLDGGSRWGYQAELTGWLTPKAYSVMKELVMLADGRTVKIGEYFKETFPRGCRFTIVSGKLVELRPGILTHQLGAGIADVADKVLTDPLVNDFLSIQDATNTQMTIMQEALENGLPLTLINTNLIDIESMKDKNNAFSGRILPIDVKGGDELMKSMYNMPSATVHPETIQWTQWILEVGKEFVGILPAIYGGEVGAQTAHEAERRLNQALQSLALAWMGMRNAWKSAYENALRMLAFNTTEAFQEFGVIPEDQLILQQCFSPLGRLTGITITVEESIPVMRAQLGALIREFLSLGPQGWALLGADSPDNATRIRDAVGLVGWNTPMAATRDWVRKQIAILLQQQPIQQMTPGGIDPASGQLLPPQPGPPMPSLPIDPTIADPGVVVPLLQQWLLTEGPKLGSDTPGVVNVHAWNEQWFMLLQQMTAPPPEPGGKLGGPPEGGLSGKGAKAPDAKK